MLLPIGDDNRDRHLTPYINYLLILANILVFIFLQDWSRNILFTFSYSTIPAEIMSGQDVITSSSIEQNPITGDLLERPGLGRTNIPIYLTLISSMFMHGNLPHLGGNMLYLWIFGDNLENDMGHFNYLLFYLLCGVIAGLSHVFSTYYFNQDPMIPSLGASGAIAGVLGGYLLQHPFRRVHVWFLFFIFSIPALIVVGLWFVFQVINGTGALGGKEASGIAYAAHIGGFIAGFILVKLFTRRKPIVKQERKSVW